MEFFDHVVAAMIFQNQKYESYKMTRPPPLSPIMLTIGSRIVNQIWAHSPLLFKHMFLLFSVLRSKLDHIPRNKQ